MKVEIYRVWTRKLLFSYASSRARERHDLIVTASGLRLTTRSNWDGKLHVGHNTRCGWFWHNVLNGMQQTRERWCDLKIEHLKSGGMPSPPPNRSSYSLTIKCILQIVNIEQTNAVPMFWLVIKTSQRILSMGSILYTGIDSRISGAVIVGEHTEISYIIYFWRRESIIAMQQRWPVTEIDRIPRSLQNCILFFN